MKKETFQISWAALGQPTPPRPYRWIPIGLLVVLFFVGVYWFGVFFDWGGHSLEFYDWATISAPRLQLLKSALLAGQLPLHIADPSSFAGISLRYLAVPDTLVSPQFILLYRTTIQRFNLYNVWLLYALGFGGLLALKARLRLSVVSFAILFFLFNFNGHLMAHYGVGLLNWGGYLLMPWFVWLALRLVDGDRSWALTLGFAALMLLIWLQGSYTQYIWLLLFLAALGICVPRLLRTTARTLGAVLLASAFRILPATLLAENLHYTSASGYPNLAALWDALVRPADMRDQGLFVPGVGGPLGSWETTAFLGLLGALFLAYYGIFRGLADGRSPFRVLALPLGGILLLSMGPLMNALPIPMMPGEEIPTRGLGVILAFGLVLAAERLQRQLDDAPDAHWLIAFCLAGLGFILVDLWGLNNIWRITNGTMEFWRAFLPDKWSVRNHYDDTIYLGLLGGGLALSGLTLLGLSGLAWRERQGFNHRDTEPRRKS